MKIWYKNEIYTIWGSVCYEGIYFFIIWDRHHNKFINVPISKCIPYMG